MAVVAALGFDEEEADALLGKAFGWSTRTYWEDKVVEKVPEPSELETVVAYLRGELGLEGPELQKVLRGFPQVLACSVQERLQENVAQLEREWGIAGPSLRSTLARKPMVLGYSVDCRGDCVAECDHCWARF